MSSECTWCEILGFIVLPFFCLFLAVLPLSLIVRLSGVRLGLRFRWLLCAAAPLLLAVAVALRYTTVLAWVGATALYLFSLAVAVVFRARHSPSVADGRASS